MSIPFIVFPIFAGPGLLLGVIGLFFPKAAEPEPPAP